MTSPRVIPDTRYVWFIFPDGHAIIVQEDTIDGEITMCGRSERWPSREDFLRDYSGQFSVYDVEAPLG